MAGEELAKAGQLIPFSRGIIPALSPPFERRIAYAGCGVR